MSAVEFVGRQQPAMTGHWRFRIQPGSGRWHL